MYLKDIQLPKSKILGNIFLAPMAGWSDSIFRSICLEHGASLCFTEMISIEGLARGNKKTEVLCKKAENEKQFAIQLFGASPTSAYKATKIITKLKPTLIDLNCGCPVPKVSNTNGGVALMQNPERLKEILLAIKSAINEDDDKISLSVKIRTGINENSKNYLEIGELIESCGASLITIHGRTKKQGYSGKSDRGAIKNLKQHLSIPVIASGDLFTPEDVKAVFEETQCDGVMIARGSMGNPFIFKQINDYLENGTYTPTTDEEKIATAIKHTILNFNDHDEKFAVNDIKKHLCCYTKGLVGGSELRNKLVHCQSKEEYFQIFDQIYHKK